MKRTQSDMQQVCNSLRLVAEKRLANCPANLALTDLDSHRLLHELQVHQIELEMQNENLRLANDTLEEARDRLVDFYETAPVGYLSVNEKGVIDNINLTGAALIGGERAKLLHKPRLKVGDRMQIQPPQRVVQDRVIVRLIGYVHNLSLLVTAPLDMNGQRMQLLEGELLIVRIFSARNAFGFSATIDKITKSPFDFLHLSFPTEVQGMVIRTAPRIKTKIIASVNTRQYASGPASAIIANLSANGALLDAPRELAATGEVINLSFRITLHGVESMLEIDAVVRAITKLDESKEGTSEFFHHGIQFVNLEANDKIMLQSLIYQQMVECPETVV